MLLTMGAYVADTVLSESLKKYPKGELGIWNKIFAGKVNSEIVIYGASRAAAHFDSRLMEEGLGMTVYNLGIHAHNFWLQYLRHCMLLKYNTKPKVIVLEVGLITIDKRKDLHDPDQFIPYMLEDSQVKYAISSYEGYGYLDFYIPLLRYYGKVELCVQALIQFLLPSYYVSDRIKGYQGVDLAWNGDWNRAKLTMNGWKGGIDPDTVRLLDSFLEECGALGIQVIFVSSPEFIEAQQYVTNRDQIFSIFKAMSTKYNIPYLDYSKHSISYKTEYFYNSSHMNKKGAELFTKKLILDLKPLLLN